MRTTVTLDDDTTQLLRTRMRERDISFKQALNDAVRDGLAAQVKRAQFRTKTYDMGVPLVDLTKANQLVAELDNEEFIRKFMST